MILLRYIALYIVARVFWWIIEDSIKTQPQKSLYRYMARGSNPYAQRAYEFEIVREDGGYRAYIKKGPSYGLRKQDMHSTHRMYDGRYYICWTNKVHSEADMKTIARHWSDCTQAYIENGTYF